MLKAIAAALLREVRASDVVARIGGDEFVVLLWNVTDADAAAKAAALEQAVYATPVRWGASTMVVGASAGVAFVGPLDTPAEVLARADAAMYARKSAKRRAMPEAVAGSTTPPAGNDALGDDIRRELVFDKGDAVAQVQLALLQALNLDDVGAWRSLQRSNRGVEVAMLLLQARKLRPKLAFFLLRHRRLGRAAAPVWASLRMSFWGIRSGVFKSGLLSSVIDRKLLWIIAF